MAISLASLLVQQTKAQIYEAAIQVATALGLNTSSWQAGDPTRSLYHLEAELLETLEEVVVGFVSSAFLDHASGTWLKILAEQVFNVEVPEATYATTAVTLTNSGTDVFEFDPGDLTFKNSSTGKTYRNTTGGTLGLGGTLDLDVEADEAGSDSSAAAGEIDEIVSGPAGVSVTNDDAAVGTDEQDEATTRQQCRDKLGSLSPNGAKGAYAYVARNSELTGVTGVTKVRTYPDSDTGEVVIYLAGPSGAVSGPTVTAVEEAIATWATPLCITPTVLSASNVSVAVTYQLWIYSSVNKTAAEIEDEIETALQDLFASASLNPIGGDASTGKLYKSLIESTILRAFPQGFRVSVAAPAGDTTLTDGQVPTLGTITPTITLVTDP